LVFVPHLVSQAPELYSSILAPCFRGAGVVTSYDYADITNIAAADIVHSFLSHFVSIEPSKQRDERNPKPLRDKQKLRPAHDEF